MSFITPVIATSARFARNSDQGSPAAPNTLIIAVSRSPEAAGMPVFFLPISGRHWNNTLVSPSSHCRGVPTENSIRPFIAGHWPFEIPGSPV